jgi:hypothetical protein
MSKYMLLLGMMLVASLSFAASAENWMQSVQGRYDCNMNYHYDLWYIANEWSMGTSGQRDTLDGYYDDMRDLSWGDMYQDAGCGPYDPYVSAFRSDMAAFNGYASSFKQTFNSILREYVTAHPTDRETIMGELNVERDDYIDCIRNNHFCSSP